ncbi:cathepsin-l, partial [Plakobranchus ocellatus]
LYDTVSYVWPFGQSLRIDYISSRKQLFAKTPYRKIHQDSSMTAIVVFLLTVCCAFASAAYRPSRKQVPPGILYNMSDAEIQTAWNKFKIDFNKTYKNEAEERKRFAIFKKNVEFIEKYNGKYLNNQSSFYLGINPFTDLTDEEFYKFHMGLREKRDLHACRKHCVTHNLNLRTSVLEQIDWREMGYVTPVKFQLKYPVVDLTFVFADDNNDDDSASATAAVACVGNDDEDDDTAAVADISDNGTVDYDEDEADDYDDDTVDKDGHFVSTEPDILPGGKSLPLGRFLETEKVIEILQRTSVNDTLSEVPRGKKDDVYFVVQNENNKDRRAQGKRSQYWDDRGAWECNSTSRSYFYKKMKNCGQLLIDKPNVVFR